MPAVNSDSGTVTPHSGAWTQKDIQSSYSNPNASSSDSSTKYLTKSQEKSQKTDDDQMMFIKLLMTELKYQDPTKPMDTEKMATTMTQETEVDRMNQMDEHMVEMVDMYRRDSFVQASGYVNKTVEAEDEGGNAMIQKDGVEYAYTIPTDAADVKLSISAGNRIVFQADGETTTGHHILKWDGTGADGKKLPIGTVVTLKVDATDGNDNPMKVLKSLRGTVSSVSMVENQPMINIGSDGASVPIPSEDLIAIGQQTNDPVSVISNKLNNLAMALQPQTPEWLMKDEAKNLLENSKLNDKKGGRRLTSPTDDEIKEKMGSVYAQQMKLRQQAMQEMLNAQSSTNAIPGTKSDDGHSEQRNGGLDSLTMVGQNRLSN